MTKPIVIVGSISMDLVTCTPRIPAVGETVIGTSFATTPGGKGANQAVTVARLGHPAHMVGKVGTDDYAQPLLNDLQQAGVNIDGMGRFRGSSGLAHIFLAENGQNCIIIVQGANADIDQAHVEAHANLIRSAGMVLLQLEIPLATIDHVLDLCADAHVPVMLDPAPAASLPDAFFPRITWLTPNETEAAFYVGEGLAAEDAAARLLAKGVHGVVLKRGAQGSYVATRGIAEWVPAFKVEAIDTVAAGDCFNGAFAVAMAEGIDPWAAARFASAAAGLSVTRRGAQAAIPTRHEVDAFLACNANR